MATRNNTGASANTSTGAADNQPAPRMTAPPPALNEYDVALDVLAAQVGQAAKDNAILSAKLRSEQVRSQHLQDQLNAAAAPADTEKGKG